MENSEGVGFLPEKYTELSGSKPVERAVDKERREGEKVSEKKEARIGSYLDRLERITEDERGFELLKERILDQYTLDAEDPETLGRVAEGLYGAELRLAIQRGQGGEVQRLGSTQEMIEHYQSQIHEKADLQRKSLSTWLEYLQRNDAKQPMWFRYYVARSLTKMGMLDKEKLEYSKRTATTLASFPELNPEALSWVYQHLTQGINPENLPADKQTTIDRLLKSKDFGKLYAFAQVETRGELNRSTTDGQWRKYDQGSDYTILERDLKGKGTGWCTAEGAAKSQLEGGDFYVYYTRGTDSTYTEPRIAIRMDEDSVGEVRGVNPHQEMEPELLEIAQEKYHALPGGESYDKITADMKLLTRLVQKQEKGEDFTADELLFLYEINSYIEGFGYDVDPRIEELKAGRNVRADLAIAFGVPPDKISTTSEEALSGGIRFHYGDLELDSLTSAKGLTLPQEIGGSLYLSGLISTEGLVLPKNVHGTLDLGGLTSAEGLNLPEEIGGALQLNSLNSTKGLNLPKKVGGYLSIRDLTSAEGLVLPEELGGLSLSTLASPEGLNLPEVIHGELYLGLTSVEGLKLPRRVEGSLDLSHLTSAKGLVLPEAVGRELILNGLTSAEDLELPSRVGGMIMLRRLSQEERDSLIRKNPALHIIRNYIT